MSEMSEMSNNELTGRDLDVALARALGWKVEVRRIYHMSVRSEWTTNQTIPTADVEQEPPEILTLPFFSVELSAIQEVEAEIERRGLYERYAEALVEVIFGNRARIYNTAIELLDYENPDGWSFVFAVAHATAEQRARAALAALSVEAGT